jgi:hypothetical protein
VLAATIALNDDFDLLFPLLDRGSQHDSVVDIRDANIRDEF